MERGYSLSYTQLLMSILLRYLKYCFQRYNHTESQISTIIINVVQCCVYFNDINLHGPRLYLHTF